MSLFLLVDAMARGGTIALLVLWSLILLRDHRELFAARMAVALNVGIVCHVLVTIPNDAIRFPGDRLFDMVSICVPAVFWLFTRAWFNDEERIGWAGWASLPLTVVLLLGVYATWPTGGTPLLIAGALLRLAMFGFTLAGLWVAWKGRDGDLVEARRKLRWRLVGAVGLYVLLTNSVEVLVNQGLLAEVWRSVIEIGITFLTFAFCAVMFGIRQEDLLGAPRRVAAPNEPRPALDEALAARLVHAMEHDRAYRDEGLTIAGLAARLGEQEYRLRRLINGSLGHRNFAQFLNGYRLTEVRAALTDPTQREVPILTIALDAGFGSLGPFNRAFRDAEGMTPSEYRNRALADSGIG